MASLTIYISRVTHQTDSIAIEAHYTTDTGIGGTRSIDVEPQASSAQMEQAIIDEVKRHCLAKWGLTYDVLTDRTIFCSQLRIAV